MCERTMAAESNTTDEMVLEMAASQNNESSTSNREDIFIDLGRADNLLKAFSVLYRDKQFVDVTIVVGSREFPCHRNVLALSSPFFMGLFSSDMAESHQEKITLKDMDALTMELVLDYIYTGEVSLSEETVQSLLSASNMFQLLHLRTGCAEFMTNHITVSNCIGVYFFAKAHECGELAGKAKTILNNQFITLCKQQEFLSLPVDKLVEIISDDEINVTAEEIVYEACMEWLNYSIDTRSVHLVVIMNCVRFANISSYYFCDKIDTNSMLQNALPLKKMLDDIRYFHILKNRQLEMDLNLMPRRGMSYFRGVMILANPYTEDSLKKYNSMEMLMPWTGEVYHVFKLPQSLYTPGCAITGDNQIYLAGGAVRKINYRGSITTEGVANGLYLFDQIEGTWQIKASMSIPRSQFSFTVVDGYLFATGGQDGTEILDSVEQYDPQVNVWTTVVPLPQPLRFMTTVSYRGKLYVFGGESISDISSAAYKYCPAESKWKTLPSMQSPRVLAGSVVYQDKIYVIGGNAAISEKWRKEFLPEHCVSSVEIFDPETETWSPGPELPNALCGAGVVKYGNTVLIVGGEDDKSWMAGLCWLREDKGRQHWVEGQELPTVMSTFGCVVANMPQGIQNSQ